MVTTLSELSACTGNTVKSIIKVLLLSRHTRLPDIDCRGRRLCILGNGPSLRDVFDRHMRLLTDNDTLAVNFAANDVSFVTVRPKYYALADPHFFTGADTDPNVTRLIANLESVDWDMTLLIPASGPACRFHISNNHVTICRINCVGVEGFGWLTDKVYDKRLGMPRPHNVLIPALMTAIWLGYGEIIILGADHSWTRTLSVDDENHVVSIQPHFYADNKSEQQRVTAVYNKRRLHEVLRSFYITFKSYHDIARYASKRGIRILNATPGSFIDAFDRIDINRLNN